MVSLFLAMMVSRPAGGRGNPGQVFRQRGPQPHGAVAAPHPLWILLLPCQIYPLPPGTLLLKALLMPKLLLRECFGEQRRGTVFRPHKGPPSLPV